MRRADNKKQPLVIDLVDAAKALFFMHKKRSRFYEQVGCTVQKVGTGAIL
jgi:hypothetical protein